MTHFYIQKLSKYTYASLQHVKARILHANTHRNSNLKGLHLHNWIEGTALDV